MSDVPQGEGWWQASDGRWYAPELHPDHQASPGGGQTPPEGPAGGTPPPSEGGQAAQGPGQPGPAETAPIPPQGHGAPPQGPPPGGPPPSTGGGAGKAILFVALGIVGFGVLAGGALLALLWFAGDEAAADDEVLLEPFGDPGPDPFTPDVAAEPDEGLVAFAEQGPPPPPEGAEEAADPSDALEQREGHLAIDGGTPGLYGGTGQQGSCDVDQLAGFLAANQDLAAAWAGVHEIDIAHIPGYLDTLTPVNLAADTRVLNHGFADGEATPREAVLQRGTAVLVDEEGVPRVKCECGNPLLEPTVVEEAEYEGEAWPTFEPRQLLVIERSTTVVESFELVDVRTGERFHRPVGGRGLDDVLPEPQEVAEEPAEPVEEPAEEPVEQEQATDGTCGSFTEEFDGLVITVVYEGSQITCEDALRIAEAFRDGQGEPAEEGTGVVVEGWTCNPATAAQTEDGLAGTCRMHQEEIQLTFDPDQELEVDGRQAAEDCGLTDPLAPEGWDNVDIEPVRVTAFRGNPVDCSELLSMGGEYQTRFVRKALEGDLPELWGETMDVRGWECTLPPTAAFEQEGEGIIDRIDCVAPTGAEFWLEEP